MSINIERQRRIYETKEYDQFRKMDANRQVRERHVKALMQSIKSYGNLLDLYPIVVIQKNGHLEIHDGQHRLEACRRLGEPVFYIVDKENRLSIQTVRATNARQEKWSSGDYLDSFCEQGLQPYLELRAFLKKYPMGITYAVRVASGGTRSRVMFRFKVGLMKLDDIDFAEQLGASVRDMSEFVVKPWSAQFMSAVAMLLRNPHYDHDRMLLKLREVGYIEDPKPDSLEWANELERIYNYRVHKHVVTFDRIDAQGRMYKAGRWVKIDEGEIKDASADHRRVLQHVPTEFSPRDVEIAAEQVGVNIAKSTAAAWIAKWIEQGRAVRLGYGRYTKTTKELTESS